MMIQRFCFVSHKQSMYHLGFKPTKSAKNITLFCLHAASILDIFDQKLGLIVFFIKLTGYLTP